MNRALRQEETIGQKQPKVTSRTTHKHGSRGITKK